MFGHDKDEDTTTDDSVLSTSPVQDDAVVDEATEETPELSLPDVTSSDTPAHEEPAEMHEDESIEAPEVTPSFTAPEPEGESPASSHSTPTGDLGALKDEALKDLSAIADKIDLPADEKLETIMMLYESTKDQSLLRSAYEAVKGLTDETKRAEALLDLIHKIDAAS